MDTDSDNESACSIRSYPSIAASEASSGSVKDVGNKSCEGNLLGMDKKMDVELEAGLGDKRTLGNEDLLGIDTFQG